MFKESITENKIPPNFLNSILTNSSLYDMFKNDFDNNIEYFQGVDKEEYLREMLIFIEDTLFSSNMFHLYGTVASLEVPSGKISYIKTFYDDFLLEAFRNNPENILKTRFFKGLEFARMNDLYASTIDEFRELYDYVFIESLDYSGIVEVLIKDSLAALLENRTLNVKEFDVLCDYVKNNINGNVNMDIVTGMLHNHIYKTNHIFDREVVVELVKSTIEDYLSSFKIEVDVQFQDGLDSKELSGHSFSENKIFLDYSLCDEFISLNYVLLFEKAFYEAELIKIYTLIIVDECDMATLKALYELIIYKVDLNRIFVDEDYKPTEYYSDLKSSCFVKTLRFFSVFSVNLFNSYIMSKSNKIDFDGIEEDSVFSQKEVSLDQRFSTAFLKYPNKQEILKRYTVMRTIYTSDGVRKKTVDLIKSLKEENTREFLIEYLHSRVIEPEDMIEDVIDLFSYKPRDEFLKEFIINELKYIYVDTFYYSLDSYLKLHANKLDAYEYLDDLVIKINCIKDTPLTHRFIDEAIFVIDDMKQNA